MRKLALPKASLANNTIMALVASLVATVFIGSVENLTITEKIYVFLTFCIVMFAMVDASRPINKPDGR